MSYVKVIALSLNVFQNKSTLHNNLFMVQNSSTNMHLYTRLSADLTINFVGAGHYQPFPRRCCFALTADNQT